MEIGVSFETAGESGKSRALAKVTLMVDFVAIGAHWKKPRFVIANGEWHPGEHYPRVDSIVTNMSRPAANGETRQAMVTACISVFLTRECECSILLACRKCVAATGITSFATST
jgi:hypothetical protein